MTRALLGAGQASAIPLFHAHTAAKVKGMNIYLLLTLPLVSGLIGWGTNALAIRMLFNPLEGVGLWRIGWRGVLPANAERMATFCVQLMT